MYRVIDLFYNMVTLISYDFLCRYGRTKAATQVKARLVWREVDRDRQTDRLIYGDRSIDRQTDRPKSTGMVRYENVGSKNNMQTLSYRIRREKKMV